MAKIKPVTAPVAEVDGLVLLLEDLQTLVDEGTIEVRYVDDDGKELDQPEYRVIED